MTTLRDYHERTKHSPASVRMNAYALDWENQPIPFKVYPDLDPIPLPTDLPRSQHPASPGPPELEAWVKPHKQHSPSPAAVGEGQGVRAP